MSDDNIFRFNINKIVDKGIVSTLYPVFTTNKYLDSRYLQIQLNHGNEFAKYALLQKQGGSRTYMYLSKLKKLVLTMPNSISEQKTISNFFDTLDNLIALHQRKPKCIILISHFRLRLPSIRKNDHASPHTKKCLAQANRSLRMDERFSYCAGIKTQSCAAHG